jgi:hypothetical protein
MSWVDEELGAADFGDERLNQRGRKVVERLAEQPLFSIPSACTGWAEIQAAYRFFDNDKVTPAKVLAPHVAATIERMREQPFVLCIQDTSELDYTGHPQTRGLGPLNYPKRRGLYVHPTLAVTPQRLCLGGIDHHLWVRDAATHGDQTRRRKKALADKESQRWVDGYGGVCTVAQQLPTTQLMDVADREADIYDVFLAAAAAGNLVEVLIRSRHDRALEGGGKLRARVASAAVLGTVEFDLPPADNRLGRHVVQELQARCCTLQAPYRPKGEKKLPNLAVTAVWAREPNPPPGVEPVQWLLLTTRSVLTFEQAAALVELYLCRWQIEVYFRILKSGCAIEKLQLEDVERLKPALAVYMIIAWRVLFLTMLGRQYPNLPCDVVFASAEWQAVYVVTKHTAPPPKPPSLSVMIAMIAEWGGFTNRRTDGPPGPKTIWIGLQRAKDFARGVEAQKQLEAAGCA